MGDIPHNPLIETDIDFSILGHKNLGRYCELTDTEENKDLKEGMDFRLPENRRETFMRFYEYHLKYRSHPGAVYYVIPYLSEKYKWDQEQKYWFTFINGCTQNPLTSWVLFNKFPDVNTVNLDDMETWHREYWRNLEYDIDRRYQKGHFDEMVENYKKNLDGKTQTAFFNDLITQEGDGSKFSKVWNKVKNDFFMYGGYQHFHTLNI